MEDELTGKVFVKSELHVKEKGDKGFQLEAIIDGNLTRLQASGEVPVACVYDRRHELSVAARESLPPQYIVSCKCGYQIEMADVNSHYKPFAQ